MYVSFKPGISLGIYSIDLGIYTQWYMCKVTNALLFIITKTINKSNVYQ